MVGRSDYHVPGREAVIARVEVGAGAKAGRHTHPGDEISYIMEGEALLLVDGQPPRRVKAGESFVVPAGSSTMRTTTRTHRSSCWACTSWKKASRWPRPRLEAGGDGRHNSVAEPSVRPPRKHEQRGLDLRQREEIGVVVHQQRAVFQRQRRHQAGVRIADDQPFVPRAPEQLGRNFVRG